MQVMFDVITVFHNDAAIPGPAQLAPIENAVEVMPFFRHVVAAYVTCAHLEPFYYRFLGLILIPLVPPFSVRLM